MASYTTNLNLKKPAGSENVAIGDINNNMDTIDTAYGTLNSKVTQSQGYSGLNNKVSWRTMGQLCEVVIYGLAFADASQMASAGVPTPSMGYVCISLYNASENCGKIEYANGEWSGTKNTSSGYTTGYGSIMYLINE